MLTRHDLFPDAEEEQSDGFAEALLDLWTAEETGRDESQEPAESADERPAAQSATNTTTMRGKLNIGNLQNPVT